MDMDGGDRVLLARIDERLTGLTTEVSALHAFLTDRVVTKEQCELAQHKHDVRRGYDRAETLAKIIALMSVAIGIFWAVLKNV